MRLLDRYLLREFLIPLGYCLGGFLIFWITFQLFSELDEFQRARLTTWEIIRYFLIILPDLLNRVVPLALLLAMLYALNQHCRHHELTAMRVAGLSLWRIALPYLTVCATAGMLLFSLSEWLMPDSADQAEALLKSHQPGAAADLNRRKNLAFKNERAGRIWQIGEFDLLTHEMIRPYVQWGTTNQGEIHMTAERGALTNGVWTFYGVQFLVYRTNDIAPWRGSTNEFQAPEFRETPSQIRSEIKISSLTTFKQARGVQLTLREIGEYRRWHPGETDKEAMLSTKYHVRLSAPFTCVVVALIALPFGALPGRRNVFAGVAGSIFICFAYFVVQRFGEAAGMGGHLSPWLAGWLPNLMFGAAGVYLTYRVK
jgi:LPS export ABC transporter permease LptG